MLFTEGIDGAVLCRSVDVTVLCFDTQVINLCCAVGAAVMVLEFCSAAAIMRTISHISDLSDAQRLNLPISRPTHLVHV